MGKSSKKPENKVKAAHDVIKPTKPLKKAKREAEDDWETKVNLKKQKKDKKTKSENKETMEGFTDFLQMIEAKVDLLRTKVDLLTSKMDLLATNADLQAMLTSMKGKKVPAKKTLAIAASNSEDSSDNLSSDDEVAETKIPSAKNGSLTARAESSSSDDESSSDEEPAKKPVKDSSSFEDESEDDSHDQKKTAPPTGKAASSSDSDEVDADRGSVQTIYVEGFGSLLPENDIKSALNKHFRACGEITRVFVPTIPETGVVKGFAYIDLKEGVNKALELNGSDMAGKELVVKTALLMRDSYPGYSGNGGIGGRFGGRFGSVGGRFGRSFGSVGGIYGGGRCGGLGLCRRC